MAPTFSFALAFTLLLALSCARNLQGTSRSSFFPSHLGDVPGKYNYVCSPQRFRDQGLDMAKFGYCDKSLSYEARAKALVDLMTLEEKAQQMGSTSSGVPRIGLPKYEWWSEGLHGVADTGPGTYFDQFVPGATSFPTVLLTAASFNRSLWKTLGQVVSTEARAIYNLGRGGLTYWSPNINVARDPRWGRTMETPGEDPYVVGVYGVDYVRGLQDIEGTIDNQTDLNVRPLKVAACCKHYAAYDIEDWEGIDRFHFDAKVTEQDMMETFLRPFEMCVKEGDASSVMCSFNKVNGFPTCADPVLLKGKIRGEWNLHGYIVADCDSIKTIVKEQKWLGDTPEDAAAQVLNAGLDLDCGVYYNISLHNAVMQGKVRESNIDKSLQTIYVVLMRVGFFDGNPTYNTLDKKDVCSDEHMELAAEAARQGIVLLKNENQTLPLPSSHFKKLAVVGPHANATKAMIANYAGIPCRYVSPIDGFSAYGEVMYAKGCVDVACQNDSMIFPAMQAAKEADATVVLVGLDLTFEAEDLDRVDLLLPNYQTQLVEQVAQASKGPVILIVMSGSGVDISFAKSNTKIQSILWVGYPGQEGGRAIADVVFGKYNPGGRLPLTWHEADYVNQVPMTSMSLRPVESFGYPGRTYKFFNGTTIYPFGHGLSYTNFTYKITPLTESVNFKLSKYQQCHSLNHTKHHCPATAINDLTCDSQIKFDVTVENVGEVDGSDVVVVYSKPPKGITGTHSKQVIGFERVFVPAKGSQKVKFSFDACKSLNIIDNAGYNLLPSGLHTIMAGDEDAAALTLVNVEFSH